MRLNPCFRAALPLFIITAAVGCSDSDPTEPGGDVCALRTTLTLAVAASGDLSSDDCIANATAVDHYTWTATANQAVNITLASTVFDPLLAVSNPDGTIPIAQNNDVAQGNPNSRVKLIAAAGEHTVSATSVNALASGAYTLTVNNTDASAENCELVFVEPGVTTQQSLAPTDCVLFPPFNDDQFRVFLTANTRIRITMRSTPIDSYLELYAPSGAFAAEDDDSGGGTGGLDAQIVYNVTVSGFYIISASSASPGETGAYTLAVELAPAAASASTQLLPQSQTMKPGARRPRSTR